MNRDVPVRLIASDLDGTLLDATGRLAPRTPAAGRRPPESGVLKILVSHADLTGSALIDRVRSFVPDGIEVAPSGKPVLRPTD